VTPEEGEGEKKKKKKIGNLMVYAGHLDEMSKC
jgi:hypothetical protein